VKTITIIVMSDYKLDPRVYKHAIIAKKNGYNINVISVTTPMHDHYEEIDGVHVYYHSLISPIGIKLLDVFKNICKSSILNKCKLNQTSIHIIKNTKINDVIKYMFVYVFSNIVLFFKIRKIKTDLYLVNDLPVIFTGFLLSKVNKKPVIYDSHELWVEFDEHFSNIFKNLLLWHERTFIRRVSCVVTVNHQIAAILMERYNIKPPLVVFNCPMYSEPLDNNMRFNNNIIYQGRYCENRGLEEILESSKNIHCNLYMRGFDYCSGEYESKLKELVIKDNLKQVIFIKPVDMREMVVSLNGFDVGIIPYRPTNLDYVYASPNKLFEYMMAGMAVVGSDLPVISNIIQTSSCGLVFDPDDPENISNIINTIMNDPEQLLLMKKSSCNFSKIHWNWEIQSKPLIEEYKKLIGV